jgi:hypothetical protein
MDLLTLMFHEELNSSCFLIAGNIPLCDSTTLTSWTDFCHSVLCSKGKLLLGMTSLLSSDMHVCVCVCVCVFIMVKAQALNWSPIGLI